MAAGDNPAFAGRAPSTPPTNPASLILWAVRTKRISAARAGYYAREVAARRDVSVLRDLVVPPEAPDVTAHSWQIALDQVHSALDSVDWDATNTERTSLIDQGDGADASALDWAQMFGPTSARRCRAEGGE
jgi:hypothetical protein